MSSQKRDAAIVGIHEYAARKAPGMSPLQIKAACAARALEDAGLTWADVDALYDAGDAAAGITGLTISEYFGLKPGIIDTTGTGGSSFEVLASHAKSDIARGKARVALLTYGSTTLSGGLRPLAGNAPDPVSNMEDPFGVTLIANYALVAQRHMYQYGTTPEQLAEIAVVTRAHAMRNPEAVAAMNDLSFKDIGEIGVDDVVSSRIIADPIHLLECCMVSDGGGAVVIASRDVAHDTNHTPVWILGGGEASRYPENGRDITVTASAQSGPTAFGEAGVSPSEMDVAMLYDSFTITVLTMLEDLGFCAKGEGGAFVEGGRLRFDTPGGPALNTDGGGLSSNHPGMRGIFLLIEATRQLRGHSTAQVEGARLAVASGNGGMLGTRHVAGTVVLARD
jgi:acetyl-CoA C-acetyltransferase